MKLFLASEGNDPEILKKLDQFVGGLKDKTILFVPTGAIGGSRNKSWDLEYSTVIDLKKYGAKIHVLELENQKLHKQDFYTLDKPDIIWMTGGKSSYLLYWIYKTKFDLYVRSLLQSGSIYVGSSAGSMICSNTQYATEWYLGEPDLEIRGMQGLSLIDFEIYPHFNDHQLNQIKNLWKQGKLYLLKNNEAITVSNGVVEVLGETRIITT